MSFFLPEEFSAVRMDHILFTHHPSSVDTSVGRVHVSDTVINAAVTVGVHVSARAPAFSPFGSIPAGEMAALRGNSSFRSSRKLYTIFPAPACETQLRERERHEQVSPRC